MNSLKVICNIIILVMWACYPWL